MFNSNHEIVFLQKHVLDKAQPFAKKATRPRARLYNHKATGFSQPQLRTRFGLYWNANYDTEANCATVKYFVNTVINEMRTL